MSAGESIAYLEGYLWDKPAAKAACLKAAEVAHKAGGRLALTLSDAFCVDRWRDEFRDLVEKHVDILFANESEITSLYEAPDFDGAMQEVRRHVHFAALTRGPKGSVVLRGEEVHVVDMVPPARLVDTTGAGDLYAAGFLRVAYEDLHRAPAETLRRVMDFLLGPGVVADAALEEAVRYASFENMRKLEEGDRYGMQGRGTGEGEDARKVRKGRVGGYREALSAEDVAYLDERIRATLSPVYGY